jgi:periplasmic divalent cation tolerance protein
VENDPRPCLVLTTWPADQPVEAFIRGMVEARLAACVHVTAAGRSTYWWDGAIEDAAEQQLVIKTTRGRLAALGAYVRAAHPYAVPEWLELEAAGSTSYAAWIAASVAGDG